MDSLPIAVRVYPTIKKRKQSKQWKYVRPDSMLVVDTETRIDPTQRLTFGNYRFIVRGECLEEGLFFADDLTEDELRVLQNYVEKHKADTVLPTRLHLLRLEEFLGKFFSTAYKGRALVVGFNLPFDLSRLGFDVTYSRAPFVGGFSIGLWSYRMKSGEDARDSFRPRVVIKHIDSKRSLIAFTTRRSPDKTDQIPDQSKDGKPDPLFRNRGHFLDLHTLAFALTNENYSLAGACDAFKVEHGKLEVAEHGKVYEEYIDYNRRDVQATAELAEKLLAEYDRHPVPLQETKAFSPAAIGKAYLKAMGITPIVERHQSFQPYLGYAQTAFLGGRASAHIRKVPVPVVYTDFLSMYPTVNSLLGLWDYVVARNITVQNHCPVEVEAFLKQITAEKLFDPKTWKNLCAFVLVLPDGDILPSRATYSSASNDWQVAVNHLYADNDPKKALWFALPDVVASVILTGKIPTILDAFRIEPVGKLRSLSPTKLLGVIEVDPSSRDFFKAVIEERKRVSSRKDLSAADKDRVGKALKVLANSTSYGIYAEMNREESDRQQNIWCHGIDSTGFPTRVSSPDKPGQYCFPPLASLITAAAHLMLALLEHSITELGGTYAMEDTDSMAIVANEHGGLFPCKGGAYVTRDGQSAVRALSWEQVGRITAKFIPLNPYDRDAVPGPILKIEDENYDPKTGLQRQLWCYAISVKRYALFIRNTDGEPEIVKSSEHGLAHLLNPIDPDSDDRNWIRQLWKKLIRRSLNQKSPSLKFGKTLAVGKAGITSPALLELFSRYNEGKKFSEQIKPFNFYVTCHLSPLGHPLGVDPTQFHLIGRFSNDPKQWMKQKWIDRYSGKAFNISTDWCLHSRETAIVKTYGEILEEYEFHPEAKYADDSGDAGGRLSIGLLQRRHIKIEHIEYIGKESNSLEEVEAGMIHSAKNVYGEYVDLRRDEWVTKAVPAMKLVTVKYLIVETGLSRRTIIYARGGKKRPHRDHQKLIVQALRKNGNL
jgi:hypothetical protein